LKSKEIVSTPKSGMRVEFMVMPGRSSTAASTVGNF
jgi:hypothetical protein